MGPGFRRDDGIVLRHSGESRNPFLRVALRIKLGPGFRRDDGTALRHSGQSRNPFLRVALGIKLGPGFRRDDGYEALSFRRKPESILLFARHRFHASAATAKDPHAAHGLLANPTLHQGASANGQM
jgi:hypothetical protein